jgi:hypothetical protein
VFVTHDQAEALGLADRLAGHEPRAESSSSARPARSTSGPPRAFVADFLGAYSFLRARATAADRATLAGTVLRITGAALTAGTDVELAVRPERVRLAAALRRQRLPRGSESLVYQARRRGGGATRHGNVLARGDGARGGAPGVGQAVHAHVPARRSCSSLVVESPRRPRNDAACQRLHRTARPVSYFKAKGTRLAAAERAFAQRQALAQNPTLRMDLAPSARQQS